MKAFITGISGQDGSYLAELLLSLGYEVHGLVRRQSTLESLWRLSGCKDSLTLHYGDVTDASRIWRLVNEIEPDEVYNLAAQSHVRVSFDNPAYTMDSIVTGTLNILEAARAVHASKDVRVYQASSSEMFGGGNGMQNEQTPFVPRSPYGCAKVASHHLAHTYRESYDMFVACGILFNHESPRRGETFVTRKITRTLAAIKRGFCDKLTLGNMDAWRDWGFAPEYVHAMYLMLHHDEPDDFVVATGKAQSVWQFLARACYELGMNEHDVLEIDTRFRRPNEVYRLCGDASKARELLNWKPSVSFYELVRLMCESDLENILGRPAVSVAVA